MNTLVPRSSRTMASVGTTITFSRMERVTSMRTTIDGFNDRSAFSTATSIGNVRDPSSMARPTNETRPPRASTA